MPTWRVDAYQVEDFASVTYQMKSTGEKIVQEQEFRVPIGGNAKLGRRFTDNWKVVQTSAYNILFDQRLPLVSVHYMHIEERYKGTAGFPLSPGATLSVTAQGKAYGPLAPGSTPNESYGIDLTKSF